MKVRFLGLIKSQTKTTGCSSCGSRSSSQTNGVRQTRKKVFLKSGRQLDVVYGKTYDVSSEDGLALLELTYFYNGTIYPQFEVV